MTSPVGSIQDGLGKIDPKRPIVAFKNNVIQITVTKLSCPCPVYKAQAISLSTTGEYNWNTKYY